MTCIISAKDSKGKLWMVGDRRIAVDDYYSQTPQPKVVKRQGILFGYAGDAMLGQSLAYDLTLPKTILKDIRLYVMELLYSNIQKHLKRKDYPPEKDVSVLVGIKRKLYHVNIIKEAIEVLEVETPFAIGSGREYALGSFLTQSEYNVYTGTTISVRERLIKAVDISSCFCMSVDNKIDAIHE